ncbi:unnamed protein product, partial [Rotaria magnacalcarata]
MAVVDVEMIDAGGSAIIKESWLSCVAGGGKEKGIECGVDVIRGGSGGGLVGRV